MPTATTAGDAEGAGVRDGASARVRVDVGDREAVGDGVRDLVAVRDGVPVGDLVGVFVGVAEGEGWSVMVVDGVRVGVRVTDAEATDVVVEFQLGEALAESLGECDDDGDGRAVVELAADALEEVEAIAEAEKSDDALALTLACAGAVTAAEIEAVPESSGDVLGREDVSGDVDVETDAVDELDAFAETDTALLCETLSEPLLDAREDCVALFKLEYVDRGGLNVDLKLGRAVGGADSEPVSVAWLLCETETDSDGEPDGLLL
jgi:hypothetical protein